MISRQLHRSVLIRWLYGEKEEIMNDLKNWGFRRPYCSPDTGSILAKTGEEALKLVNFMYGSCGGTTVYCAETGERYINKYGKAKKIGINEAV